MRSLLLRTSFVLLAAISLAAAQYPSEKVHGPDCSGGWPTDMTFVHLKNAGLVDNGSIIDRSKIRTVRIASEKIGKGLWRQVYHVTFMKTSGETIEAIAVHDASLAGGPSFAWFAKGGHSQI
jgi:hypothetical protein